MAAKGGEQTFRGRPMPSSWEASRKRVSFSVVLLLAAVGEPLLHTLSLTILDTPCRQCPDLARDQSNHLAARKLSSRTFNVPFRQEDNTRSI